MFDLTPQLKLEGEWERRYRAFRSVLVALFFGLIVLTGYFILFPITRLEYVFGDRQDSSPLIADFRPESDQAGAEEKILPADALFSFRAFDSEPRSEVTVGFTLSSGSIGNTETLTLQKGYQAFAYPLSPQKAAFPDGTLLRNGNDFYIQSEGLLRRFRNEMLAKEMGYRTEIFISATAEELSVSPQGAPVEQPFPYPESTLFSENGKYYLLTNGKLVPFVSRNAFTSRYSTEQAVRLDEKIKNAYPLSSRTLGFAEGSLIALNQKVFVVSEGRSFPVPDPVTFNSFGFLWDEVIYNVSAEEVGEYSEDQLFDMARPHPSGTVFRERESGKSYLIWDGEKKEIVGSHILSSWLKRRPIEVSRENIAFEGKCSFEKGMLFRSHYSCRISDPRLETLPGNGYHLSFQPQNQVALEQIRITFSDNLTWNNLRLSLSRIKNRLMSNYGYPNQ